MLCWYIHPHVVNRRSASTLYAFNFDQEFEYELARSPVRSDCRYRKRLECQPTDRLWGSERPPRVFVCALSDRAHWVRSSRQPNQFACSGRLNRFLQHQGIDGDNAFALGQDQQRIDLGLDDPQIGSKRKHR